MAWSERVVERDGVRLSCRDWGGSGPPVVLLHGLAGHAGEWDTLARALSPDYRVVADNAAFNTSFAGVALTADSGISWTLPRVVGPGRAADLLLFPRSITAQEARELGIVNRLVPAGDFRAETEKVARALAEGPTVAYGAIKESLAYALSHSLEESLEKEDELQTRAGMSEDHVIAVQAFVNKEKPKYLGR